MLKFHILHSEQYVYSSYILFWGSFFTDLIIFYI